MKKLLILIILMTGCSGYNIRIAGVDPNLFKKRDWVKVGAGVISSLTTHELSHLLYAKAYSGGHFEPSNFSIVMENYYNADYGTQQMFHRVGFLGQLFVGSILTAIPETRRCDFTFGFNAFTTVNTAIYTLTGGRDKNTSDIRKLDNGIVEGTLYTIGAGILTLENVREK